MKYAIIDIGSNTIRLNMYLVRGEETIPLIQKKVTAGLASYIDKKTMSEKGINKLISTIEKLNKIIELFKIDRKYVFATAAVRNAKNCDEIIKRVEEETGVEIDLIAGKREALLGLNAVQSEYNFYSGIVLDVGGGSSEITIIDKGKIIYEESIPEGSLSTFTNYVEGLFPTKKEEKKIRKGMREALETLKAPTVKKKYSAYGIGGTIRCAGNLSSELMSTGNPKHISKADLDEIIKGLLDSKKEVIGTLLQVNPSRIHTATTGFIVLSEILNYLSVDEVFISDKSIREGFLQEKIGEENE